MTGFDLERRVVHAMSPARLHAIELPYDSLIVAAGVNQSYFGHDELARFAPGMKTIDDAWSFAGGSSAPSRWRRSAPDAGERQRWLTIVIVGAGPTGVELAGQVRELAVRCLKGEFRTFDPASVRVLLVDGGKEPLATFGDQLSGKATQELERLGVELRMGASCRRCRRPRRRRDATRVARSLGSMRSPRSGPPACRPRRWRPSWPRRAGPTVDRAGRIAVLPDLTLPGHPEVFAIGDMATLDNLPGVAEVAMQGGLHAANTISRRLKGKDAVPFKYRDMGSVATIGRFQPSPACASGASAGSPVGSSGSSSTSRSSPASATASRRWRAGSARWSAGVGPSASSAPPTPAATSACRRRSGTSFSPTSTRMRRRPIPRKRRLDDASLNSRRRVGAVRQQH